MPSRYVYIPILFVCAPLIISVVGTFTLLAVLTSSLALFVISIRLGFLAMEFSGGFVFDFIKWGVAKFTVDNPHQQKNKKDTKVTIKDPIHHKQKKYIKSSMTSFSTKTKKFYNSNGSGNNFVSNDDYFMVSMINNKRPNGRRARSDYI